ncbi:hypothetical protein AB1Y20_000651 [Prymnesium parvum]|uniref:Cellulase n=1 Tax=Prymnesium parvum TaxID=97485 RepID=A0AB34K952_PRYPA
MQEKATFTVLLLSSRNRRNRHLRCTSHLVRILSFLMLSFVVFLPAARVSDVFVKAACHANTTHGCFNGQPYSFSDQFPCGAHGVYGYGSYSCCEQGRPFSTTDQYCCTGSGKFGVHSYTDGKCDSSTPDQCACYDTLKQTPNFNAMATSEPNALIDTSKPPELGDQCDGMSGGGNYGCLNGYNFSFAEYSACGNYLMEYGKYGCCPSPAGFLPYLLGVMYCCKVEGAQPGHDYQLSGSACKCHRYGCDGWPMGP